MDRSHTQQSDQITICCTGFLAKKGKAFLGSAASVDECSALQLYQVLANPFALQDRPVVQKPTTPGWGCPLGQQAAGIRWGTPTGRKGLAAFQEH